MFKNQRIETSTGATLTIGCEFVAYRWYGFWFRRLFIGVCRVVPNQSPFDEAKHQAAESKAREAAA